MLGGEPDPADLQPGVFPIEHGMVELRKDLDVLGGWEIRVDGVLSSYLDVDDPTYLDFEYVRWIAAVLGTLVPPRARPAVLHLGGAGCTLPRWLGVERPGSDNTVVEYDGALVSLLGKAFGIADGPGLRIVVAEAAAQVSATGPAAYDLVIRDAFVSDDDGDPHVPDHLRSKDFTAQVHRVLRPGGSYIANLTDRQPLVAARQEVVTLQQEFAHVCAVTEPGILHGHRYGNVVLVASDEPLPITELGRAVRNDPISTTAVSATRFLEGR